jgi:hypothetical protein
MEFLSRLLTNTTNTKDIKEDNFLFQIDRIRVYSSVSPVDDDISVYHDICGFLFKETDIICSVHNNKPPSRDEIRASLVAMHSFGALKPTEESANFLYKMLAGCKKKKSRGKKDEDDEEEEDDDDEVLRIVRRKETIVKTPVQVKKMVLERKKEKVQVDEEEGEVEDEEDGGEVEDGEEENDAAEAEDNDEDDEDEEDEDLELGEDLS